MRLACDQNPCGSTVLWGQCSSQITTVKPSYDPTIPGLMGTRVSKDWCIMILNQAEARVESVGTYVVVPISSLSLKNWSRSDDTTGIKTNIFS